MMPAYRMNNIYQKNSNFRGFLCLLEAIEAQILKLFSVTAGFTHTPNFLAFPLNPGAGALGDLS